MRAIRSLATTAVALFAFGCGRTSLRTPPACATTDTTTHAPHTSPRGAFCSAHEWCWDTPLPQGEPVMAVWVSPDHHVWTAFGGEGAGIARWDGAQWTAFVPVAGARWTAIDGIDDNDIWLSGWLADARIVAHGHEGAWTVLPALPVTPTSGSSPPALWARSSTDVWVHDTWLAHWDGTRWTEVAPFGPGNNATVFGRVGSEVWVARDHDIARFDGVAWHSVPAPDDATYTPFAIAGTSASDAWIATGNSGTAHWDGARWTPASANDPSSAGRPSLLAFASDDVWALDSRSVNSTLRHWQGSAWEAVDAPANVWAFAGRDARDLWVGGANGFVAERDAGGVWSTRAGDNSGTDFAFDAVAVTDTGDYWLGAREFPYSDHRRGRITHRDAGRTIREDAFDHAVTAVWANAADDVWAAGEQGFAAHWDGTQWSRASEGLGAQEAVDLWSTGDDVWLVAGGQLLRRTVGSAWRVVDLPQPDGGQPFATFSVTGTGPDDVWIATGPAAYWHVADLYVGHWDGDAWTLVRVGSIAHSQFSLARAVIRAVGPHDVWLAGVRDAIGATPRIAGNVLHGDGTHWERVPVYALTLWGRSPCDVWFFTETAERALHWDGASLRAISLPGSSVFAASGAPNGAMVAVTFYGGVLTRGW